MKAFVSYSSKEMDAVRKLERFLNTLGINSFIANDDLRIGSDWKKRIVLELKCCELFIPLLSKEFKKSEWCSQELGIAYIRNKEIIPISLDGTKSYGFINHIQSKSLKDQSIEVLLSEGLMEIKEINNACGFIELLKKTGSFRYSELIFKSIMPYTRLINNNDLNEIIKISIKNSQIWAASECSSKYIPQLLNDRKDDIDLLLLKKIKYQIDEQKWYTE
jgi:hypothetical protein